MLSKRNRAFLDTLVDIYDVSLRCGTKTYIWGGLVQDVLSGKFLREHGDIDAFTLNLWALQDDLIAAYQSRGYVVKIVEDVQFLVIERGEVHVVFNQLELDGETAMWRHAGREGTVYFPASWLSDTPQDFYHTRVYLSGIALEYCMKTHPRLLSPEWNGREKDAAAIKWLKARLDAGHIDCLEILKRVWSYNPFWLKKGYPEYAMPVVASTLEPGE